MVYIVDDDLAVCSALQRLIRSVGLEAETFTSARDFLEAKHIDRPGCMVLDVRLPDLSGLNLQEKLADANIDLPIIFITGFGDIPMTVRAMKAGALEFLTKPINEQQLLDAMQQGIEKHRRQLTRRGQMTDLQARYRSLTNRERQILPLVADGYLNKQIAAELGTSEKTIKIHRGQVMVKMKAGSVADLVRMATMLGLPSSRTQRLSAYSPDPASKRAEQSPDF
ncbi:two-component response regulator [Acidisarcina polymorpha]|uniref:Two-component response regulator n=1 Tax=Acidisarcina polymorpha TaxID=2211140 RepID=A0A2Z5G7A9_9BACT|nr:two-component response regulator [Acidisarcina polymorpha]